MRKSLKIFFVISVLSILLVTSCEQDVIKFKGPYHVRFTQSSSSAKESYSKPINIPVHNAGPALDEDVTVTFDVSGDAREGVDYVIIGEQRSMVIPAGEYVGNIQIQLINNSNNILRSQDIIFTLTTVNESSLQVGQGVSGIGKEFTFTIFDDCILGGNYFGKRDVFSIPVKDISIVSEDCEHYILSNWNVNIFSGYPFPMNLTFEDKGDNTLIIPAQEDDDLPSSRATIQGSGFVDPETKQITLTVQLVDYEGQPEFTFTLYPD